MSVDYGWLDRTPRDGRRVGLVVQAAYHLDELVPLRDELRARGIAADILVPVPPRKPLNHFRPGMRRFRELLGATPLRLGPPVTADGLVADLSALVVMNDWGTPKALVESSRAREVPTFAWIEGVQDFGDVDTGQSRGAYTHVDHVFCLGRYGADRLPGTARTVVGSARLRALWNGPCARPAAPMATINSNFTYGVLTEHRRSWVASVMTACRVAGMPRVLSRHAAERGLVLPYRASDRSIGELLAASTHLVGRFSTVGYEALIRGVEFVYHNPHGEKEPTFSDPMGAFARTASTEELTRQLQEPARSAEGIRAAAAEFLHHHLRLEDGPSPAEIAADTIEESLAN